MGVLSILRGTNMRIDFELKRKLRWNIKSNQIYIGVIFLLHTARTVPRCKKYSNDCSNCKLSRWISMRKKTILISSGRVKGRTAHFHIFQTQNSLPRYSEQLTNDVKTKLNKGISAAFRSISSWAFSFYKRTSYFSAALQRQLFIERVLTCTCRFL